MKRHYLHISYQAKDSNYGGTFVGDCLIWITGTNLDGLRKHIKELVEKEKGIELENNPQILSLTEISKDLYDILIGEDDGEGSDV